MVRVLQGERLITRTNRPQQAREHDQSDACPDCAERGEGEIERGVSPVCFDFRAISLERARFNEATIRARFMSL